MARQYEFVFNVQRAEFRPNGIVSVIYGPGDTLAGATQTCTFAEALTYLADLSESLPGPHAAMLGMKYRNDRRPPGWKTARRCIYKESNHEAQ